MPQYDPRKPHLLFGAAGGVKPLIVQEGCCYDVNGNSLDAKFQEDKSPVNLIQWLYQNGYSITPEARAIIIREKKRVILMRQAEELQRQIDRQIAEETARVEQQLALTDQQMRAQVELHLKKPDELKPPLPLTEAEMEVLGIGQTDAAEGDLPSLEELVPEELEDLAGLPEVNPPAKVTRASRSSAGKAAAAPKKAAK